MRPRYGCATPSSAAANVHLDRPRAIGVIPIFLTFGTEDWGRFLSEIPIINNNTHFIRWWSIYMIPLIVGAALSFDYLVSGSRIRDVIFGTCVLASAISANNS